MNEMKKKLYLPLILIQAYLSFTVILYTYGPWDWQTNNPITLYFLLILFQVFLAIGYIHKMKGKAKQEISKEFIENQRKKSQISLYSLKFLKFLILLNLIFICLNLVRTLNLSSLSIQVLWEQLMLGFTDPAAQYRDSKMAAAKFGGSLLAYSNVLLAPLLWLAIPVSLYRFKEFSLVYKFSILVMVMLEATRWISIGTNKGFIDLIIIFLTIYMVKKLSLFENAKNLIKDKRKSKKGWLIIVIMTLIIGLTVFSKSIDDRVQGNWTDLSTTLNYTNIDFESPLMTIIPETLQPTLIYMGSYMTQGYYAMSLATTLNWLPMLGVGNSMFLMENLSPIFNFNLFDFTYQSRLESLNWDPLVNWHSFYTWVANDISFLGVTLLMYLLGRFFASITFNSLALGDNLAIAIMCLLIILFVYIPANNQVMSYPTTFMAFWILTLIWIFKKRYKLVLR